MKPFETHLQVRFGHVDPAGIAYFPRIFDYVHDVFEEVWEHLVGVRYYQLILEEHVGFPLVHSEADFRAPLCFGDRPRVEVTCFRLGRSSLGLRYRILKDDTLCVEARMTTACVDVRTMQSLPISEAFRERFETIREIS